jgi:hypothetical protein
MPASIPTKGIADLLLRAGPIVERTAGGAVSSSSMAPKMARAMRGCALRAPFAASSVPLVASGENRQSNHLVGPSRKVSGLRPSDGQSFPVCSAPCQHHAASPTTDRPFQLAYANARSAREFPTACHAG